MDDKEFQRIIERLKNNDPTLTWLRLGNYGLTPGQIEKLAEALQNNITLKELNLSENEISDAGAKALAKALRNNNTLTELNLTWNQIGPEGTVELAEALQSNNTLRTLELPGNKIGPEGAKAFAKTLQTNTTLAFLLLTSCKLGDDGAEALAAGLRGNHTLRELYILRNEISAKGALALANQLQTNISLTHFQISDNRIGLDALKKFDTLFQNHKNILQYSPGIANESYSWNQVDYELPSNLKEHLSNNERMAKKYAAKLRTFDTVFDRNQLFDLWDRRFAVAHHLIESFDSSRMKPSEAEMLIQKAIAPLLLSKESYHHLIETGGLGIVIDHLRDTNQRLTPELLAYKTPGGPRIVDLIAKQGKLSSVFNYEHMHGQHVKMAEIYNSLSPKHQAQVPEWERTMIDLNEKASTNVRQKPDQPSHRTLSRKNHQPEPMGVFTSGLFALESQKSQGPNF